MSEPCTITIYRTAAGYLFRIRGRGTLNESPAVRDFVCGAIEDGAQIVLDLSECSYLDSTFLGCLVIMQQRSHVHSGSFRLFASDEKCADLFHSCALDHLLEFDHELPEIISEPVNLKVTPIERREFCQHLIDTHQQLADLGGPSSETFRGIVEQLRQDLDAGTGG